MIGGGVAAALLACQMESKAYREETETPSYTVPEPMYPRASESATFNGCMTESATFNGCMTSMPCIIFSTGSLL